MKILSLTILFTWLGLREEGSFQRVESPIASSANLTELNQLDILLGRDLASFKAFLTRVSSFRWEILCQNLMIRTIPKRAVGMMPSSP